MKKSYKYRLLPTKNQIKWLEFNIETCRWIYNETLAIRKEAYVEHGIQLGLYETYKFIPNWRKQNPELNQVYVQVLREAQLRVNLAYKGFFRRTKKGLNPGYPRFKGKGRYNSFTFPQYGEIVKLENDFLTIGKIGRVRIKMHRPLSGAIKTTTIFRNKNNKWFVSFVVDYNLSKFTERKTSVGIDVGLKTFATFSDGKTIENPKFFRTDEKALAKAQQKMSEFVKGSTEWNKHRKVVSRIHERITNRRNNFTHQISRQIVNEYGTICVENLNIKGMLESDIKRLNKSIADASWGQFITFISYKAEDAGREFVMVDPRNTSKRCSRCNTIVDKTLSDRVHNCPICGLSVDRDLNASINILALGLQSIGMIRRSSTL